MAFTTEEGIANAIILLKLMRCGGLGMRTKL